LAGPERQSRNSRAIFLESIRDSKRATARMLMVWRLRGVPSLSRDGLRVARRTILGSRERRQSYMLLSLGLLIAIALPFLLRPREGPAARKSIPVSSE
jgi:hypothetical protein